MKYQRVVATDLGGPEVLTVVEENLPEPQRGEVRVKVLTMGVSFADILLREGIHPEARKPPFTPGWDVVGVVDRLGSGVNAVEVGEMVAALPIVGGYSEYVVLPAEELLPVPDGVDPAEAVSVVLNYGTAYQMLHRSARARRGERALIHGAGGGVGTALLQLGALHGLEMYGTARADKHAAIASMGAHSIDYTQSDFVAEIDKLTRGEGIDIVFDGIGADHVGRSYRTLRRGGRVIAYGHATSLIDRTLTHGRRSRFRGLPSLAAQIVKYSVIPDRRHVRLYSIQTLRKRHQDWFRDDMAALFDLLADGKIKPVVAGRLPLAEAARAHELLGGGSVTGKLVLVSPSFIDELDQTPTEGGLGRSDGN